MKSERYGCVLAIAVPHPWAGTFAQAPRSALPEISTRNTRFVGNIFLATRHHGSKLTQSHTNKSPFIDRCPMRFAQAE